MKKTRFYVCPDCGSITAASGEAGVTCCGRKLRPLEPRKADEAHALDIENIENELYITSDHPMERGHYISFIALLTADSVFIKKLYPEWDMQVRLPILPYGRLFWYCSGHGLFYRDM